MKKNDIILIAILILVATCLMAVIYGNPEKGAEVIVSVEGKESARYPLSEDQTIEIAGKGGKNIMVIQNHAVYLSEADCPDKLCVKQGKIQHAGASIICLPHEVVVEIQGTEGDDAPDAIAR